jgi:hypothetical protein
VDGTIRALQEAQADVLVLSIPSSPSGSALTSPDGEDVSPDAPAVVRVFDDGSGGDAAGPSEPARLEIGAADPCQTPLGQLLRRAPCEVLLARPAPRG